MRNKVLTLGREEVTERINRALKLEGIDVHCLKTLPEMLNSLKHEGYDMALIDGGMADLENICFRVAWLCRLRVALVNLAPHHDKNHFSLLGANAFIPPTTPPSDLAIEIATISIRGVQEFESIKVLVVEDDRHIREAIRLSFRIFWPEADLDFADEGQTGINLVKNKAMDIVLLDLGLPDISGFDVLKYVRGFSEIPIVITTAARDQENVIRAIQSGANDYVVKPFKQIELMTRIRKYIRLKSKKPSALNPAAS
ncbi:MAG TPA: response regulator [Dehalococcoidales bacterium]|nr:response regulator [Dehalococcoidales bacterium]